MSKRKSDQFADVSDGELESLIEDMPMQSCDVVRRKIRTFIDSGEMKVGEFQKTIGANSKSYSMFMGQSGGQKGSGSMVYRNAWEFFKKRELRGIKMPTKKAKTDDTVAKEAAVDIADVQLEREMEDKVEVYDTCDEIRRKINAYLLKPGVTQAQFLRDIAQQFRTNERKIQSKQLNDFRSKKGATGGNTSAVFYGSYVFFEKLRVKEGKPKTTKRLEMETIWGGEGGLDLARIRDGGYWAPAGSIVTMDQYGKVGVNRPA